MQVSNWIASENMFLCKSNVNQLLIFPTFSNFRIYQFFHENQTRFLITYFSYVLILFAVKLSQCTFFFFFYICRKIISVYTFFFDSNPMLKIGRLVHQHHLLMSSKNQHHLDHRMLWKEYHYIPFNRPRDHLVR